MCFRLLILITALSLTTNKAVSQKDFHPSFRHFTTDDGLPSPEVHCILKDSQGFMWFGTDNGVSRFDGYSFRNYGSNNGLTKNVVLSILEDQDNRIWFSTFGGEVYIYENDSIHNWIHNNKILAYKHRYYYSKLDLVDQKGSAYFRLYELGILKVDRQGSTRLFRTNEGNISLYHDEGEHSMTTFIKVNASLALLLSLFYTLLP